MFRFISQQDKAFLNVSWDTHSTLGGPGLFLTQQKSAWAAFWNPSSKLPHQVSMQFNKFRQLARDQQTNKIFDLAAYDFALKGYKKETMGSDLWKPSEMRLLPQPLREPFASTINESLQAVASPHQYMISLNPLLGKPNNTCRTICKTQFLIVWL